MKKSSPRNKKPSAGKACGRPLRSRIESRPRIHVYGPVPSRRLGFSLGVDIMPYKTCSFNCVYCQLGPSPRVTKRRRSYFSIKQVLSQIKEKLDSKKQIDHITFSGSGEPTLNASIGKLIRGIKKMTPAIPVAVLTNSSLLARKEVRKEILGADVIVPSLDAAAEDAFLRVNRPPRSITAKKIIEGIAALRREYKGKIWLEVMLVKGINDSPADLRALKKAIGKIKPDRVQLNTVVRPPAEDFARPLTKGALEKIARKLGPAAEVVADFPRKHQAGRPEDLTRPVLEMLGRRPVTIKDMAASLGKSATAVRIALAPLVTTGKIKTRNHRGTVYFERGTGE